MKNGIEFVGGPLCGNVVSMGGAMPDVVTDWHGEEVVRYARRDASNSSTADCRPMTSTGGNRMYDHVRVIEP